MSVQAKAAIGKIYAAGNGHLAGKHSLTMGEAVCFAIAAAMVMVPSVWSKVPLLGKFGSPMIALVILFIAFVIW